MTKASHKSKLGRQIHLPLSRAFMISLQSLKIRFWRSFITAGGIFLGIAFLSSVLAQNLMQWPVPDKQIGVGLVRLDGEFYTPGDYDVWKPATVQEALAAGIPKDVVERVTQVDKVYLRDIAQQVERLERTDKALVIARQKSKAVDALPDSILQGADTKIVRIQDLKDAKLDADLIKELTNNTDMALKDFKTAVQKVYSNEQTLVDRQKRLAPFRFDKKIFDKFGDTKAYTVAEILTQAKGPTRIADTQSLKLVNTGRAIALDMKMRKAEIGKTSVKSRDLLWMPDASAKSRRIWLVVMSLLVSTIGIMNSMLMAVTERYKEIGTMKCLGALNRFVIELFLLESGLMGLCASLLGCIVGVGSIALIAVSTKGWVLLTQISVIGLLKLVGFSLCVGMLLTMTATILPAFRAAQMPPAAALRSEI